MKSFLALVALLALPVAAAHAAEEKSPPPNIAAVPSSPSRVIPDRL